MADALQIVTSRVKVAQLCLSAVRGGLFLKPVRHLVKRENYVWNFLFIYRYFIYSFFPYKRLACCIIINLTFIKRGIIENMYKIKTKKTMIYSAVLVFILVALDQITKLLASLFLKGRGPLKVIKGVFELQYLENDSAAFSLDPVSILHRVL